MTPDEMARTHAEAFTQARPWAAEEFAELLTGPHVRVFGDAICFALVQILGSEAELLTIATHPAHQRRGLARRVMTQWHDAAHDAGAERAFLDVAADNAGAMALYASCGYTSCGRRKGYYRRATTESVDAVVMQLDLTVRKENRPKGNQETG